MIKKTKRQKKLHNRKLKVIREERRIELIKLNEMVNIIADKCCGSCRYLGSMGREVCTKWSFRTIIEFDHVCPFWEGRYGN